MRHSEYIGLFRSIAAAHTSLGHSEFEPHFARIVLTKDSLMGSNGQVQEFLRGIDSNLNFPCLLAVAYHGNYSSSSGFKRKQLDGAYIVLDKVQEGDHDNEEAVYDRCEEIGEEIAAYLEHYFEEEPIRGVFDVNNLESEKLAKVANDKFGLKFYFTLNKSYNKTLAYNPDKFNF